MQRKVLVDAGYAALSKAVFDIFISTRRSISPDKVSLPAGKQPNLLFFKGLRKNCKMSNETGPTQNSMTKSYVDGRV